MVLELFLRGDDCKRLERVVLEMNHSETKAFVGKLKEIEKVLLIIIIIIHLIGVNWIIIMIIFTLIINLSSNAY